MAGKSVKKGGASCSNNWQASWRASPRPDWKGIAVLTQRAAIDRVFHALCDPTRRALVEQLTEEPVPVSWLAKPPDITLAARGPHLQAVSHPDLVLTAKA